MTDTREVLHWNDTGPLAPFKIVTRVPRAAYDYFKSWVDHEGLHPAVEKAWPLATSGYTEQKQRDIVAELRPVFKLEVIHRGHDDVEVVDTYRCGKSGFPGRMFAALPGVKGAIRAHLLAKTSDLDMVNAMPKCIVWACKEFGIHAPCWTAYVADRDAILQRVRNDKGWSKGKAKQMVISTLTSKHPLRNARGALKELDDEAKTIQDELIGRTELKWMLAFCTDGKGGLAGSFMSRLYNYIESRLLVRVKTMLEREFELAVAALVFDGLNIADPTAHGNPRILERANAVCEEVAPGIQMHFSWKALDTCLYDKNKRPLKTPMGMERHLIVPPLTVEGRSTPSVADSSNSVSPNRQRSASSPRTPHIDNTVFVASSYEAIQRRFAPSVCAVDVTHVCATLRSQTSVDPMLATLFENAADCEAARACLMGTPLANGSMKASIETTMAELPLLKMDAVDPSDLARCIPVRGAGGVVIPPTDAARIEAVTIVLERTEASQRGPGKGRIVLRRGGGQVKVGVHGTSGARKLLTLEDTDTWQRIFEQEGGAMQPAEGAIDATADAGVRPAMVQRIGEFLQQRLHANVVGLACARDPARALPMAIDDVQIRKYRAENPSFSGFWVTVKLHPSTCACACALWPSTRARAASASHVEFRMRMCAKKLRVRSNAEFEFCQRPNHSSTATALKVDERQRRLQNAFGRCVAGKAVDLVCVHTYAGKKKGSERETPLCVDKLLSCLDPEGLEHFETLMGALAEEQESGKHCDVQDPASPTSLKRKRGDKDRVMAQMLRDGRVQVRCAHSTGRFVGTRYTKSAAIGASAGDTVKIDSVFHPYLPRVANK